MHGHRRIWIDIDNSPHVPFFIPIIEGLRKRGCEVLLTARDAYQVRELLELNHLSCKVVGRHYGKNPAAKILGTCIRATQLIPHIFSRNIDLAISHGSRAQMICGFVLRIPTLLILDYEFIAKMGFIRPDWIFVPEMIPDSKELRPKRKVLRYPGLKEDVYVPRLKLVPALKDELGVVGNDIVVTVRPPATEAHYHNPEAEVLLEAALNLLTQTPDIRVILLPRNEKQGRMMRESWGKWITNRKIVIPESAVDGMNLIWFSDLVISGGGTMNREAAALGVPVYSIFRGKIGAVDRQLQREGRLILIESVEDIAGKIVLTRREKSEQRASNERPALQAILDGILEITGQTSAGSAQAMPTELAGMRNQALADYYRCPEEFADFVLDGNLPNNSEYFPLVPEAIAYGQYSSAPSVGAVRTGTHDPSQNVLVDETALRLPLDPTNIIDNLRFERYAAHAAGTNSKAVSQALTRNTYYALRPFLPLAIRRRVQRLYFRGRRETTFPNWPVDRTVDDILERLLLMSGKARGVETIPFIWFWPEGSPSCTIVTHDVEEQSGRNFCSKLMDLNDSFGIKSSFQIVPEERYAVPKSFLEEIRHRSFEINVHDLNHDGNLFSSWETFSQRIPRINQYGREYGALGFRSGALYRNLNWYHALDFSYDMSVPNVGHLEAQQGGCCTLMPFFVGKILELPVTTTQDYSLFHILKSYSIDLWKKEIALITEKHGLASFIVHPDYIMEKRAQETYRALLGHLAQMCADGKTWIALPGQVNDWWRDRSQMKLIQNNGTCHIEGPGKERARIAYATVDGDKVVYTIDQPH
jgi:predicted glycosyltransferase